MLRRRNIMKKRLINFSIVLLSLLTVFSFAIGFTVTKPVYAEEPVAVAKVGNTEYTTIDEAIANWTNNTTLTLLSDVTLSDVIKLSSTEYHVLDLGTYTMTAASKKDAIQIVNNARSSASYALDIKADATNPGGITATGKAIVRTAGKSGVKDRPIIRFYNGNFTASYIVYHSGSNGTNCPQFQFHDGIYSGTIFTNRALNQFYGGTFNGSLMMSVDSSAYTLVAGGTFKNLSNSYGSGLNSSKFAIGSAKGVYDREVYIDDDGYYVVSKTLPSDIGAVVGGITYGTSNYFKYSKLSTTGELNFTSVEVAMNNSNSKGKTIVFKETLDKELVLKQNITIDLVNGDLPSNKIVLGSSSAKLTFKCEDDSKLNSLTIESNVANYTLKKVENNGVIEYSVVKAVAQIGEVKYASLDDALAAANDGDTIKLLSAVTEEIVVDKNINFENNGFADVDDVKCVEGKHVIQVENNIVIEDHDIEYVNAKAPTCTEIGWNAYEKCAGCGYTTYSELPALGHDLKQVNAKAPTCTEIGWKKHDVCTRCDYSTYVEIEATGHAITDVDAKAPTCTEVGWKAYKVCNNVGCDFNTCEYILPNGHDITVHNAKAPTCDDIGWDMYETCSNCSYTTYAELPALGHNYICHESKEATCVEEGNYEYYECVNCGHKYSLFSFLNLTDENSLILPALGHDLVSVDAKDSTCSEKGHNAHVYCTREGCNYSTYSEINKLTHEYGSECDALCEICGQQRILSHVDEDGDKVCDHCDAYLATGCSMTVSNIPFALFVSISSIVFAVMLIVIRRRKFNR